MKLTCATCGKPVVNPEDRECGHNTAGALANLHSHAYGEAHFEQSKAMQYIVELFDRIRDAFRR